MLHLAAFVLLVIGTLLEIAGISFSGVDLLIGLCFMAALSLAAASALRARLSVVALIACGLAALALGVHLAIHLGLLS